MVVSSDVTMAAHDVPTLVGCGTAEFGDGEASALRSQTIDEREHWIDSLFVAGTSGTTGPTTRGVLFEMVVS